MKILVSDPISSSAVTVLKNEFHVVEKHYSPDELLQQIETFEAIIVRSATQVSREVVERGIKLRVIGRAGVGFDNINVKAATERQIYVVNSPHASTISVAELTMAYLLALSRKLVHATNQTKEGLWPKKQLSGTELHNKILGFVGCGRIGAEVVRRAQAFGMRCLVYDPYLPADIFQKIGAEQITELPHLFEVSDFVTVHALLTEETRGMIGTREFEKMKTTAFIVNCARGGIIDEEALYIALTKNQIAGAALDVFTVEPARKSKLFELENLYASPHIAASTQEAQDRAGQVIAEQVRLVLTGQKPTSCVNARELGLS
ncbi:MAG: hydroxyacid dehydrogenase [Candidatus Thorarchaeota archaeon]